MSWKHSNRPIAKVTVDATPTGRPLELWRHALGHGGVNSLPLPDRVVEGVRRLGPRLVRIFIQEFFHVYAGSGRLDWSRLDPYMAALAATGAKVVAAITIKPPALYPEIDQTVWRPSDVAEWQNVVRELVRRYSVQRRIVTHWEIGNEPDIGENGGCPYLITDPKAYGEYYAMTVAPILEAFPEARVGGPALASVRSPLLPGLVEFCGRTGTRLDFVSWHLYSDSPEQHADCVRLARRALEGFPGRPPETMVTEWAPAIGGRKSVEEQAHDPARAATVAASIMEMMATDLDWSFYYHVWDQTCFHDDFASIFSERGLEGMTRHWNEVPHRMGLFGVDGRVRPQYFVCRMLSRMGEQELAAQSTSEVRFMAARGEDGLSVLAVNRAAETGSDRVAVMRFRNLRPGVKRLTVHRVDGQCTWCGETLEMPPVESRDVSTAADFECHVLLPADSVAMLRLGDKE
jgi:hypothetical protein